MRSTGALCASSVNSRSFQLFAISSPKVLRCFSFGFRPSFQQDARSAAGARMPSPSHNMPDIISQTTRDGAVVHRPRTKRVPVAASVVEVFAKNGVDELRLLHL